MLHNTFLLLFGAVLVFAIGNCSDEVTRLVHGDSRNQSQETSWQVTGWSNEKSCQQCTISQWNPPIGRMPVPNNLVAGSFFNITLDKGITDGIAPQTAIRIPFDGPISLSYDTDWQQGLQLQNLSQPQDTINLWPLDVTIDGKAGHLKLVYQDDNFDLILVPGAETLSFACDYLLKVTSHLKDKNGQPVGQSNYFKLLFSQSPLLEGNQPSREYEFASKIDLSSLSILENQRLQLKNYMDSFSIEQKKQLVSLFTFKTISEQYYQKIQDRQNSMMDIVSTINNNNNDAYLGTIEEQLQFSPLSNHLGNNNNTLIIPPDSSTDELDQSITNLRDDSNYDFLPLFKGLLAHSTNETWDAKIKQYAAILGNAANIDKIYRGHFNCLNFLAQRNTNSKGEPAGEWTLDFAMALNPSRVCPKVPASDDTHSYSLSNQLDFWLSIPKELDTDKPEIAIFLHGFGGDSLQLLAMAQRFAAKKIAVIAVDLFAHGSRELPKPDSGNQNSLLGQFLRIDRPDLTAGYMQQSQLDIVRLITMIKTNPAFLFLFGGSSLVSQVGKTQQPSAFPKIYLVGVSLGGIISANLARFGDLPVDGIILNVPGADLTDIVFNSPSFFQGITSGAPQDNAFSSFLSQMSHLLESQSSSILSLFQMDPLYLNPSEVSVPFLFQRILLDTTVPERNGQLLNISLGLDNAGGADGDLDITHLDSVDQASWVFNPDYYTAIIDAAVARHGFFLDHTTTATCMAQYQAIIFLQEGLVLAPNDTRIQQLCTLEGNVQ